MQKSILTLLFSSLLGSCGENKETKTYKDPGTLEGRIEQICGCMEELDRSDWQPCYDLYNEYSEKSKGDDFDRFIEGTNDCERKFKNKNK